MIAETRELDCEIAEKIFGFKWYRSENSNKRGIFRPETKPEWFIELADMTEPLVSSHDWSVPHYSTDIAGAWLVVGHLESEGYQWAFERTDSIKSKHDNLPSARFWKFDNGKLCNFGRACSENLPKSICLAAIAALEKLKEKNDE